MGLRKILRKKVAVLLNPSAKGVDDFLVQQFLEYSRWGAADVYISESKEHSEDQVKQILDGNYDVLFVAGGDGTLFYTFSLMEKLKREKQKKPLLSLIKRGTGNAVSRLVGATPNASQLENVLFFGDKLPIYEVPLLEIQIGDEIYYSTFGGRSIDAELVGDYHNTKKNGLEGYVLAAFTKTIPRQIWKVIRGITNGFWGLTSKYSREVELQFPTGEYILGERSLFGPNKEKRVEIDSSESVKVENAHGEALGSIKLYGYGIQAFDLVGKEKGKFHMRVLNGSLATLVPELLTMLPWLWTGNFRSPRFLEIQADDVIVRNSGSKQDAPLQIGGDYVGDFVEVRYRWSEKSISLVDYNALNS